MSDTEEELRDNNGTWPTGPVSSPVWVDMSSELPEEYIQQMRNLSLRSHQQPDRSVLSRDDEDETTVNYMYGTATASEQQVSPEEQTARSNPWPPGTICCRICMDLYSKILRSGRLVLATRCGHIFCSRCLSVAIEVTGACPTCSRELTHRQYHPIYL
ncbi:E3 ubiquitin-protein ligase RNF4-like [Pipra filicauda]|uniref:E3 ubiquitin-protein ligase RNF4-like n=1 Tax=Pipra filicauda TaxID=649802 RepID=A0A7R5L816_9PASS|nr:E3 ubiquitin-protein ligase RNF4-like [Pipra filicauda]XP_039247015.1 E3 ubiquitin-protein ligase RNF4-like [Pipra filicauda]XP_039247016.1 E3 ubiquitin-protein ligase RNF4-like [Pipra filicauda]XP_039247017.1 E3 ubiquitin-protein ligase RNF4-like [Pipra filicauda]